MLWVRLLIWRDTSVNTFILLFNCVCTDLLKAFENLSFDMNLALRGVSSEEEAEQFYRLQEPEKNMHQNTIGVFFSSPFNYTLRSSFVNTPSPLTSINDQGLAFESLYLDIV